MRILKKIPICFLAIIIILGTTVSSIPNHTRATETDPLLVITSPELSSVIDGSQLTVTGFIDNIDKPAKDLVFTAYDSINTGLGIEEISNSKDNPDDWDITKSGDWTFNTNAMEGTHIISVMVQGPDPSVYALDSTLFSKAAAPDGPFVKEAQIVVSVPVIKDEENDPEIKEYSYFADDLTSVPVDSAIRIKITDENKWDIFMSKLTLDAEKYVTSPSDFKPIWIFHNSNGLVQTPLPGKYKVTASDKQNADGKYELTILFKPDPDFNFQSTYNVQVNPSLGNYVSTTDFRYVYSRSFHFTTTTKKSDEKDPNNLKFFGDPHGSYTSNTNACAMCHSTHSGSSTGLLKERQEVDKVINPGDPGAPGETEQPQEDSENLKRQTEAYCMGCHGTQKDLNNPDPIAPPPINYDKKGSNHITSFTSEKEKTNPDKHKINETESCSSCHDPHLTWTEDNPNLLQNQYSKNHNEDQILKENEPTEIIVSKYSKCLECHDGGTAPFLTFEQQEAAYQQYNYKKLSEDPTSDKTDDNLGNTNDYSLCLNCHKANGPNKAKDINQYYTNKNSGHKVEFRANGTSIPEDSLDNINTPETDENSSNGHIPCADCHDTHASDNQKLLRSKIGNIKLDGVADFKFNEHAGPDTDENGEPIMVKDEWDSTTERSFCTQCHNPESKMYGKTLALPKTKTFTSTDDPPKTTVVDLAGHDDSNTEACSSCHGTHEQTDGVELTPEQIKENFLSAAHAPIKRELSPPVVDGTEIPAEEIITPPTDEPDTTPEGENTPPAEPAAPEAEAPAETDNNATEPIVTAENKVSSSTQTGNIIKKTDNVSAIRNDNDEESAPDVEVTE